MDLQTSIEKLPFIGPAFARRLQKLNITTIENLLYHFPFRYEDLSKISPINKLKTGDTATISSTIWQIKNTYTKTHKIITTAIINDATGTISAIWFNQSYLTKTLKPGLTVNLAGKIQTFNNKLTFISPEYEPLKSSIINHKSTPIHTGRLVPIYPETYGLSSKWLRSRIKPLLDQYLPTVADWLPQSILQSENLISLNEALEWIHFPQTPEQIEQARKRLAFEELFLIQLAAISRKHQWQKKILGHQFFIDQEKVLAFLEKLPFQLTNAQTRCVREILTDLGKNKPMNRLLEGDVGSGKTIVAAIAMYISHLNGFQSILMAPTEILANQHHQTLKTLFSPLGIDVTLVTSHKKLSIVNCQLSIIIGTHALLWKNIDNAGLVIIDEQHRFGVEQRTALLAKSKIVPHLLTMTATPIPRTLALTLYGDLDLSIIDELPPGRQKIKTWVVSPEKREAAYIWIKKQVQNTNQQAFIICPFIEESETLTTVKAATTEYQKLTTEIFPDLHLGLLHGKIKSQEKEKIMQEFRNGKIDILVATPVVEVGIDIPNATIMMIEGAERFGLAQLHQLRGRVGRGQKESYCLLFTEEGQSKALKRLSAMEKMYIGMDLAEFDLQLRGPGEIHGIAQHGFPNLRVASLTDLELIQQTHQTAESIANQLDKYPLLKEKLKEYNTASIQPN